MHLSSAIWESKRAVPSAKDRLGPRFRDDQEWIQNSLTEICEGWAGHLKDTLVGIEGVFRTPEPPWKGTEGSIVSTLLGAVARRFPKSTSLEEVRVVKPGKKTTALSIKSTDKGRCDMWSSIPELSKSSDPFSFFLEAKASRFSWPVDKLEKHLLSSIGISKLFRDYIKSRPASLDQRSSHRSLVKSNTHHFVVGLLVTPIANEDWWKSSQVHEILQRVFEGSHPLHLGKGKDASVRGRKMSRYPTTALIVWDAEGKYPGMIASFTVLGST